MSAAFAAEPEIVVEPLTRDLFDALVDMGKFDDVPVELIEGELIRMAPQGWPHARAIDRLARRLDRALTQAHGDRFTVRQEKPLAATVTSEPEPDISVVDTDQITNGVGHPTSAHLVVEVSESSRRIDLLRKPAIYAAAAVPVYWVVDVTSGDVTVHQHPSAHPSPHYQSVETVSGDARLEILDITLAPSDFLD